MFFELWPGVIYKFKCRIDIEFKTTTYVFIIVFGLSLFIFLGKSVKSFLLFGSNLNLPIKKSPEYFFLLNLDLNPHSVIIIQICYV